MIALCLVRPQPPYRRDAFEKGLRKAGYTLVESGHPSSREDLLIIWNRYGSGESMASTWERSGGTVIVCENGYLGRDADDRQYYALGVHGHNGNGWFPVGDGDRFSDLHIAVRPWRILGGSDGHVVVRGQRGIGIPKVASPPSWHDETARVLRKAQPRPVRVIPHPGNVDPKPTHEEELAGAHSCVIWSSATGIRALVLGIPVFYDSPCWVGSTAAKKLNGGSIEEPLMDDQLRLMALHQMSWGQRSVAEIESGEPFVTIREHLDECPKW